MTPEDVEFPKGSFSRFKLNQYRCVICGEIRAGLRGYLFYQSGRTRLGIPFCKNHLDHSHEFANPVFENLPAVDLFKQMFPQTYQQDVEGKPIVYFNTYNRKAANAYRNRLKQKMRK
jgi:hypothetical protein